MLVLPDRSSRSRGGGLGESSVSTPKGRLGTLEADGNEGLVDASILDAKNTVHSEEVSITETSVLRPRARDGVEQKVDLNLMGRNLIPFGFSGPIRSKGGGNLSRSLSWNLSWNLSRSLSWNRSRNVNKHVNRNLKRHNLILRLRARDVRLRVRDIQHAFVVRGDRRVRAKGRRRSIIVENEGVDGSTNLILVRSVGEHKGILTEIVGARGNTAIHSKVSSTIRTEVSTCRLAKWSNGRVADNGKSIEQVGRGHKSIAHHRKERTGCIVDMKVSCVTMVSMANQ